ncbi:hypothetical protein FXO37_33502 [Capsicum annuum]|nr:hypothetical protein FXO37_33502 [Capsicum annuum]
MVEKSSVGDAEASASSMQNGENQNGTIGARDANKSSGNMLEINVSIPALSQIETPVKLSGEETPQLMQDRVELVESVSKLSWADEVEASPELNSKGSTQDNFDIAKVTNAGFKLECVAPEIYDDSPVDLRSIQRIKEAINLFSTFNLEMSKIFLASTEEGLRQSILDLMGFSLGSLPIR